MAVYIGLIIFILVLPVLVTPFFHTEEKKRNAVVFVGMLVIFLLLALKGDVGVDIPAYLRQYYVSAGKAWGDVDYIYFEPGYITLTKIFAKQGISFQGFMVFVYALACIAMYFFIKKYSKNPMLSILIFICYQFFVFYISGVRQTIAMSLCLIAYMVFQCRKFWAYILSLLIIFLAISMHSSAIIFLAVYVLSFIRAKKISVITWGGLIVASIALRPFIWELVNRYFRKVDLDTEMRLAGNFIFLCGVVIFMYFVHTPNTFLRLNLAKNTTPKDQEKDVFFARMILVCICANIVFSGHSLLRTAMYPMMFIIPGLPNTIRRLEPQTRIAAECATVIFFIALFYFETLVPNQLQLCPYEFFWK